MAITHATIKAALQKLFAVADWNAPHVGTATPEQHANEAHNPDMAEKPVYDAHDHSAADPTQVSHADLTNVSSDQHHAKQHAINSAADHTGFGDIVTRNSSEFAAATILQNAFPVGSIYLTGTNINPGTFLGFGTWVTMGAGRVLVGLDAGDPDFDTPLETGGSKTTSVAHTHAGPSHTHTGPNHTHPTGDVRLTLAQMPGHRHRLKSPTSTGYWADNSSFARANSTGHAAVIGGGAQGWFDVDGGGNQLVEDTGGDQLHSHGATGASGTGATGANGTGATGAMSANETPSVVQPYLVVYIWIRNA